MVNIPYYHAIRVKFSHKGCSPLICIRSFRFEQSVRLPYDHKTGDETKQAVDYLESRGFEIVGETELPHGETILLSTTYKPIK